MFGILGADLPPTSFTLAQLFPPSINFCLFKLPVHHGFVEVHRVPFSMACPYPNGIAGCGSVGAPRGGCAARWLPRLDVRAGAAQPVRASW